MTEKTQLLNLTVLGVYADELPIEFFDRVEFKKELLTLPIGKKDTVFSIIKPLIKKYPQYRAEIKQFNNICFGYSSTALEKISAPLLAPGSELTNGVIHLTLL